MSHAVEQHFSLQQLAELWNLSLDTVRDLFANEPGVLIVCIGDETRKKRHYRTIRVPASVVARVHMRLEHP